MKTKKMVAVLLLLLGSSGTFSQNKQSLTNDDLFLWKGNGFYGAIDYNWADLDGTPCAVNGGKAVFIYDHRVGLGFGFSSVNTNKLNHHGVTDLNFGGPELEYFIHPHKLIFPSVNLFSGLAYCRNCQNKDNVLWFIEPGAKIWINVASFMRFSMNANYRQFENKTNFNAHVLNGVNFGFSVAYGKF